MSDHRDKTLSAITSTFRPASRGELEALRWCREKLDPRKVGELVVMNLPPETVTGRTRADTLSADSIGSPGVEVAALSPPIAAMRAR
jgi:hypothetical protein